jgi:hypothetical protein
MIGRELVSYAELGWLVPAAMVEQLIRHIEETAATAAGLTPEELELAHLTSDRAA